MPLIGIVLLKLLGKRILIPLGLTVAATDAAIHKKVFGSGATTLITSNEEINDIMKIVKSLEESGLLKKRVTETIKNEATEQKGGFLVMLLCPLGASLLGNLLTDEGAIALRQGCERSETLASQVNMPGRGTIRAGEGTFRAGEGTLKAGQDI